MARAAALVLAFTSGLALARVGVAAAAPPITEFSQGVGTAPSSLTDGPDGNLWFVDAGAIGRITPTGQVTEFTAGLNPGSDPHAIIAGPGGNLWFTDTGATKAVGEITPTGTITEFAAGTHGLNPGAVPYDMTQGPDGSAWFLDIGPTRAIGEIGASGTITEDTYSNDLNDLLNGIAEGPDGNIYFTVQGNTPAVGEANTTTHTVTRTLVGAGRLPNDLTAGADGSVWWDDDTTSTVSRLSPGGGTNTDFGTTAGVQTGAQPDAITAGPDGNVWFIDQYAAHNAVGRVTPAGTVTEFPIGGTPWDITPGIDGNLWMPISGPAILRVTPTGTITTITSGFDSTAVLADGTNITVGPDGNLWTIDEGAPKAIVRVDVMLAPVAVTGGASAVTTSSATVAGTTNPRGNGARVAVDYGTTPALGSSVTAGTISASDVATGVSAALTGLPAATRIYYRVQATNAYGTSSGSTASFTTAAASGVGPISGSRRRTTIRRLTLGNRRVVITVRSPAGACVARTASLAVSLRASRLGGAHVIHGRVRDARLYLDRGVRHVRHVRRHGHRRTIATYKPNAIVHRLPAHRTLRLARLRRGRHVLRITVDATQSVHRGGRRESHPISRTVRIGFRVC